MTPFLLFPPLILNCVALPLLTVTVLGSQLTRALTPRRRHVAISEDSGLQRERWPQPHSPLAPEAALPSP